MGLDMYLYKKTYLTTADFYKPEHRYEISLKKGGVELDSSNIKYVIEEVAYWRKANAIHRWFVTNVQNGVDDCGEYSVEFKQLEQLREVCKSVLNDIQAGSTELAERELATQEGFFFGDTDYDEYYESGLQNTVEALDRLMSNPDAKYETYIYCSSW